MGISEFLSTAGFRRVMDTEWRGQMGVEILLPGEQRRWEVLTMRKRGVNRCWNSGDSGKNGKPEAEVRRPLEGELSSWKHTECWRTERTKAVK